MTKKFIGILVLVVSFLVVGFLPQTSSAAYTKMHTKAAENLQGRILLQVDSMGEAWYIDPVDGYRYYLGRPVDAFDIMRGLGLGATTATIEQLPGVMVGSGNTELAERFSGRILLDVEANGEAWYIDPADLQAHYLGRPADAFDIMRSTGLGVTTSTINRISSNIQIAGIFFNGAWSREADEFVDIFNYGRMDINLKGWVVVDEAEHDFTFPQASLWKQGNVRVYTNTGTYRFGYNWAIWNNDGDTAILQAPTGAVVDTYSY